MTGSAVEIEITLKVNADLLTEALRQISARTPEVAVDAALRLLVETERAKRQDAPGR